MSMGRRRQSNLDLPPRMRLSRGCYYYDGKENGKRKWFKLDTDLRKARIMWSQMENGGPGHSSLFSTLLDEYLVSKKFLKLADKTRRQYEYVANELKEFYKGARVSDITPAHVAMWMDNHISDIQANTGKAITSNVFKAAVRHGLVDRNPAKEIEYHKIDGRELYITDEQFRQIYAAAKPHVQIAMDLGYLTGSRIQDILDIKLQDISDTGMYIRQGKTKEKMLFLMSPAIEYVINAARALPRPIRGMHLLCDHSGQPYKYGTFNVHWLEAIRSVGLDGIHFHDIRGKAATDAKELGMDYQALLGHTTRAMSDRYIKARGIKKVAGLPTKL